MQFGRIESSLAWHEFIVLRMFRRWVAARDAELQPLPNLVEFARQIEQPFEVAVALDSVFQLTESCLGRPLVAECCCSREIVADERAILMLIASAPSGVSAGQSSRTIPHGLPGALCWAVHIFRDFVGLSAQFGPRALICPFEGNDSIQVGRRRTGAGKLPN